MKTKATLLCVVAVATVLVALHGRAQTRGLASGLNAQPQPAAATATLGAATATLSEAQVLCSLVSEIKVLPMKGEKGIDTIYDALIAAGDAVVPCLIDKVADTTPMPDPRQTPKFSETTVGDVAFFVLVDSTDLDFIAPLPPEVRQAYRDEGVYAYFDYVAKIDNRLKLQRNLRDWRSRR